VSTGEGKAKQYPGTFLKFSEVEFISDSRFLFACLLVGFVCLFVCFFNYLGLIREKETRILTGAWVRKRRGTLLRPIRTWNPKKSKHGGRLITVVILDSFSCTRRIICTLEISKTQKRKPPESFNYPSFRKCGKSTSKIFY